MKKQRFIQAFIIAAGLLGLTLFQNCSKVQATDIPVESKVSASGEPVATATDGNDQVIPVDVQPATDVVIAPTEPAAPTAEPTPSLEPTAQPITLQKDCGLDLKTIQNVVDVDQFSEKEVHLAVLHGKTLVYSSSGEFHLTSLTIGTASGRTILCGVIVDELTVQKGRLDVFSSEIKKLNSNSNNVRADSSSILPAGF
jgi:hypothetical protein